MYYNIYCLNGENSERLQVYYEKHERFINTEKFTELLVFKFHRTQTQFKK